MNAWISVKDRLPEQEQVCLCLSSDVNHEYTKQIWCYHDRFCEWYWGMVGIGSSITHWMPLPDAPNE